MATIVATQTRSLSSTSLSTVYNEADLTYNSAGVLYDNNNTWVDISNTDFLSIQISGTFVANWVLQVSLNGVWWHNFAMHQTTQSDSTTDSTTGTAPGFFNKPCSGMKYFRCILTAYTSGTVNCIINETILRK